MQSPVEVRFGFYTFLAGVFPATVRKKENPKMWVIVVHRVHMPVAVFVSEESRRVGLVSGSTRYQRHD